MKKLTGFELLNRLKSTPSVIMTTSKPEYAFEAYQYDIIDFIQKPIKPDRFRNAITKVLALEKFSTSKSEPIQSAMIFS
jgi:two-component system, LytTR family, response regulator